MSDLPKLPTIIRDSREKPDYGFRFIASKTCAGMIIEKLDFGDYAIQGFPKLITIERKASVLELCNNIGKNRDRFERELQRMVDAEVKRKYIIVEDYWSAAIKKQRFSNIPGNVIFESIIALELKYDLHFVFTGTHTLAQKIARSLLIKAWDYHQKGIL